MRRTLLALLTVGLLVGCQDGEIPTVPDRPSATGAISDGSGSFDEGNSHFFWLAPMVAQPDESLFGAFDPAMQPTVRIVCLEDSDPGATCDPGTDLAEFSVGSGLVVESDHYKVEFDTQAPDPALRTSSGADDFTTYRIQVLTPPLGRFGGPFLFGFADFQLGANGKEARNLDSEETIGLVDGRTLPIRFRLDEGALEEELEAHTAPPDDPTGAEAFCQINCSVTVIDQEADTEASLFEGDEELTAMLIPAGAVWTDETAVLVIDERVDDGDGEEGEECLPFSTLRTEACFRYELSPDNPDGDDFFPDDPNSFVRFGVCPEGQAVTGSGTIRETWRLLKADEDDGEVVITRPDEVDVTDFLQCNVTTTTALWDGAGGRLAGSALQWLVAPLDASDLWGGQLRDLSDLFWGEDVEMSRLLDFPSSATEGTTLQMTVELLAVHPDPDQPVEREVTFTTTTGTLADPDGNVSPTNGSITLLTDATTGQATVNWTIVDGANRLEVTSPHARPAAGEPDPVAFEVTGDPLAVIGSWTTSGSMTDTRRDHTATVLDNDDVLVVAGTGTGAELWSVSDGSFSPVSTVVEHGQGAAATELADGRVLITGGNGAPQQAEIFDPADGSFTALNGTMVAQRSYHSATLLPDGRVLLAAGQESTTDGPQTVASAEIFDPSDNSFTSVGDLADDRSGHAAVHLGNGVVLVAGGTQTTTPGSGVALSTAELFDLQSNGFTSTGSMVDARTGARAVLLGNGRVLVTGGFGLTSTELYDPADGTFSATGSTSGPHASGTLTLLSDGRALVAGGVVEVGPVTTDEAEVYDPSAGTWSPAAPMNDFRQQHTATLLSDGRVLAVGGSSSETESDLASAEFFSVQTVE